MQRESVLYYNNFWYFFGTNGSPPLSLSSPTIRFLIFCYCVEISCLELSLSLSKTLLSLSFVLARVCMCSTPPSFFLLLILFQIKNLLSQKALSLSLSLSLGRSCCLRTTTTIRTAMIEQRRRREKTAASWWWWWRGDSWCTWSRGSLKFGGTNQKCFSLISHVLFFFFAGTLDTRLHLAPPLSLLAR